MNKNLIKIIVLIILMNIQNAVIAQAIDLPPLLITEIGAFEATGYEWVEIYNTTDTPIDMANVYFYEDATKHRLQLYQADLLLEPTTYGVIVQDPIKFLEKYTGYSGKIFDSSWSTLREDGEEIGLMRKADETFFEKFTYLPSPDNSLKRKTLALDYTDMNWSTLGDPNPGQENQIPEEPIPEPIPEPAVPGETPLPSEPPTETSEPPLETSASGSTVTYVGGYNPETQTPPPLLPKLLINEAAFKNSLEDFVELFMVDDQNFGKGSDVSGFTIENDALKFSLPAGKTMKTGEYFLLKIPSPGLTQTTEQIFLKDKNGKLLDAVCWFSSKIAESEKTDMMTLFIEEGWNSEKPETCISSEKVKGNQSIGRILPPADTNTAEDFEIFVHMTPGISNVIKNEAPKAVIDIQSGEIEKVAPLSLNLDGSLSSDAEGDPLTFLWDFGDATTETTKNPKLHTYEKPGDYEIRLRVQDAFEATDVATLLIHVLSQKPQEDDVFVSTLHFDNEEYDDFGLEISQNETYSGKTSKESKSKRSKKPQYQNGDLSSLLRITEILPNPEGPDNEDEWIEIYNSEARDIRLGNWKLDDSEGGSKPYVFPDTASIKARGFLVLMREDTKLALNNSKDSVRLFDFENMLISQTSYPKTEEGKSYALLSSPYHKKPDFEWISEVTPGEKNPQLEKLSGKIVELRPDLETAVLSDTSGKIFTVSLRNIMSRDMAEAAIPENADVEMEVQRNEDGTFSLRRLYDVNPPEIKKIDPAEKKRFPWWIIVVIAGAAMTHFILFLKRHTAPRGES